VRGKILCSYYAFSQSNSTVHKAELAQDKCYQGGELDEVSDDTLTQALNMSLSAKRESLDRSMTATSAPVVRTSKSSSMSFA
jgi:hypothetical protein